MSSLHKNPVYRRLRVGGRGLASSSSYWLAADHLIIVEDNGFSERSRRVELRDITALVAVMTPLRSQVTAMLSVPLAGCVLLLVPALVSPEWDWLRPVVAVLATVLGMTMAVHLGRGPMCRGVLHTRVQAWPLPQVSRWRAARRLLAELRPAVLAAQAGEATAETPVAPPPMTAPNPLP